MYSNYKINHAVVNKDGHMTNDILSQALDLTEETEEIKKKNRFTYICTFMSIQSSDTLSFILALHKAVFFSDD